MRIIHPATVKRTIVKRGTAYLALLAAATAAGAIVSRHDVDIVATRAEALRVAAVGKVLPDGEGALIAPDWVLTAAHVATGAHREQLRVVFSGIGYTVSGVEPARLFIRLDPPDDGALPAEGISGPCDSGTPLLVETGTALEIVGVGSVGVDPAGGRYGEYGSEDVFMRTSHYRA